MTVKEFIKDKNNFIITRNGEILGIKNDAGSQIDVSILSEEIKSIDIIKGLYADITGIRL